MTRSGPAIGACSFAIAARAAVGFLDDALGVVDTASAPRASVRCGGSYARARARRVRSPGPRTARLTAALGTPKARAAAEKPFSSTTLARTASCAGAQMRLKPVSNSLASPRLLFHPGGIQANSLGMKKGRRALPAGLLRVEFAAQGSLPR